MIVLCDEEIAELLPPLTNGRKEGGEEKRNTQKLEDVRLSFSFWQRFPWTDSILLLSIVEEATLECQVWILLWYNNPSSFPLDAHVETREGMVV